MKQRRKLLWTLILPWLHWAGPSSAEDAPQGAGAAEPEAAALTMQCPRPRRLQSGCSGFQSVWPMQVCHAMPECSSAGGGAFEPADWSRMIEEPIGAGLIRGVPECSSAGGGAFEPADWSRTIVVPIGVGFIRGASRKHPG